MNHSVDKTKEVPKEIAHYQKEALQALLAENIDLAQDWYLAADAAAHFLRRKISCELLGSPPSPLIHQVATLMTSPGKEQNLEPPIEAYRYWIACAQALSSSNSILQLSTHLRAIQDECEKNLPTASSILQEAYFYFSTITHSKQENLLSSSRLLDYQWTAIVYDAFFLATSKNRTPHSVEILLSRKRAIHAREAHHQQRAQIWSLIALARENLFEENLQQEIDSLEEQLSHGKIGESWERALCWLFVNKQTYQRDNAQNARVSSSLIIKKWLHASALEMKRKRIARFSFFSKWHAHYAVLIAQHTEKRYRSLIKITLLYEVTFALPAPCWPTETQQKEQSQGVIFPELEYTVFYNWIYQTWHYLTRAGIPCKLSDQLSNEGIIITLGGSLPPLFGKKTLSKNLFLVDVVADNPPFPEAHLHIVQNKKQARKTKNSFYIPHWPQPHLIPRDPERKNRFENICFFGHEKNLAPELQTSSWQQELKKELGLHFKIKSPQEWHDYSDVDCVIAIRDFSKKAHLDKPGTKLYNAWLAGVPFIGGNDSAYHTDGHPGTNYLVASSLEKLFESLKRLKEDEKIRIKLVEEGKKSAVQFTQQATLERWKKLVTETIPALAMKRF